MDLEPSLYFDMLKNSAHSRMLDLVYSYDPVTAELPHRP
jgi:hypothetical protein